MKSLSVPFQVKKYGDLESLESRNQLGKRKGWEMAWVRARGVRGLVDGQDHEAAGFTLLLLLHD
jgi:hypothetical protein